MQSDIFRFKQQNLIHFLTEHFHTRSTNSGVYSDSDFKKCMELESVHLVVFLLPCLANPQLAISSSKFSLKQQKERNTQGKNIKSGREMYLQGDTRLPPGRVLV
jgi:predicted proteasome-type protease